MKNSPKKIFLQLGLEETDSVEDFNMLERDFVTWESNQIYSDDLQFISVDFIFARIQELKVEIKELDTGSSSMANGFKLNRLRGIKKELENLIK